VKLGCVFTQTRKMRRVNRYGILRAPLMWPHWNRPLSLAPCCAPKRSGGDWRWPSWLFFWATGPPGCGNWRG
jgi:hypothetical protein